MTAPTITKELHQYTVRLAAPETEFAPEFPQMMANRMAVSFLKYGPVANGYPEMLVDAANFALIEFMHPRHPDAYFAATDSDQSPGRTRVDGSVDAGRNDAGPARTRTPRCRAGW